MQVKNMINEYLVKNNIEMEDLKNSKHFIEEIIYILKNNFDISSRKISLYIGIGRETVRKIVKELSKKADPFDNLKGEMNEC